MPINEEMKPVLPPEAEQLTEEFVENARLLSSRETLLRILPRGADIVEVGVGLGDFSKLIPKVCQPSLFIAIDEFKLHELDRLRGRQTSEVFGDRTHEQTYRDRFSREIDLGTMVVRCGDSARELQRLHDQSVDVAYIDADHRYAFVRGDWGAVFPKLQPARWVVVNDYIMVAELHAHEPYGVIHAANEFMIRNHWGISHFALQSRMFCDVAMRPSALLRAERMRAEHAAELGASIVQSTSWTMTAPFRMVSRFVRRLAMTIANVSVSRQNEKNSRFWQSDDKLGNRGLIDNPVFARGGGSGAKHSGCDHARFHHSSSLPNVTRLATSARPRNSCRTFYTRTDP